MDTAVVAGTPNNFQMVSSMGTDLYLVNYGREMFSINSTLRRSDGKIIRAEMTNQLNVKVKVNCDKDYRNCPFNVPFSEQRTLTLELLPSPGH